MADMFTQATIHPFLPIGTLTPDEIEALSDACGLSCDELTGALYLVAYEHFTEEGQDANEQRVNCTTMLQAKLKQLDPAEYPHIIIEGATSCSKMRPGEFGGFAYFITREEIRYTSTWQWLHIQETERGMLKPDETIVF